MPSPILGVLGIGDHRGGAAVAGIAGECVETVPSSNHSSVPIATTVPSTLVQVEGQSCLTARWFAVGHAVCDGQSAASRPVDAG